MYISIVYKIRKKVKFIIYVVVGMKMKVLQNRVTRDFLIKNVLKWIFFDMKN